jgi:phospholipid/cholesterol/gamma-HCH transport system ATP-binding protein
MEPIISVKNLVAKYGDNIVLDNISVDIFPGEITVILGGSGWWKNHSFEEYLRLVEPFSGSVKIWGEEVLDLDDIQMANILKR